MEGESASIITSGKSHSLSSSTTILCLFDSGEISFGVVLLSIVQCLLFLSMF